MTSAEDARAAVAAEIARLRDAYLARLPVELLELEQLAAGLSSDEGARPTLDELHHRLHKLAGSGGTFGLGALGEHARQLELTAKAWLSGSLDKLTPSGLQAFASGLTALHATLGHNDAVALPAAGNGVPAHKTGHSPRIWLVEDDALLGQELARLLTQFGYDLQLFTRIDSAECAAANDRPDLLIMDVMFTAENLNATEVLKVRPALMALGCPTLFISAFGDFASRTRAARLGAAGFMLKPIDVPRLVDRIERILDEDQAVPYRVLIVDDDVDLAEHFRLVLQAAGMDAESLNRPEDVIDRVTAFRPELILLDVNMPGCSGPELATVIRHHDEWIGLPIVYLSAETDLDRQIEALGRGADDFIAKPISDRQLVAAVRVRAARSRQLADLMSKDSLTGLLKHARIKEEVAIEVARAQRSGQVLSVAMLDIDHFKSVNDTYGHAVGDQVIRAVAHLLRQRLRKSDQIGRYGGEEFVALLPDCGEATAEHIINDVRIRFAALRFRHESNEFACTLSAGIACTARAEKATGGELLVAADTALYAAKHGGRNQVCSADPGGR